MLHREKALNRNIDVSTLTLKNWVGLKDFAEHDKAQVNSKAYADQHYDQIVEERYRNRTVKTNVVTEKNNKTSHYDNSEFIQDDKVSHAHCLHQSFETLVQGLYTKIDTLQKSQIDINDLDIITERASQTSEKLRSEIRGIAAYVQEIETRNRILEEKVEILLMQTEIVTQKCSYLELLYERFFSNTTETDNDLHHGRSMSYEGTTPYYVPKEHNAKPRTTTDLHENVITNATGKPLEEKMFHSGNIFSEEDDESILDDLYLHNMQQTDYTNEAINEDYNIEELHQTKQNMEKFIQKNYPGDYKRLKKYNKRSMTGWFKKFLG